MKTVIIIVTTVSTFIVATCFILGQNSKSGNALGLFNGKLQKCPDTPNCVCSEQFNDPEHYIPALALPKRDSKTFWIILKKIIIELNGEIKNENDTYISATFSSTLFGFVDDVEIRMDSDQKTIQLRSASRVGHSDFGVNKKRITLIKKMFMERTSMNYK